MAASFRNLAFGPRMLIPLREENARLGLHGMNPERFQGARAAAVIGNGASVKLTGLETWGIALVRDAFREAVPAP